MEKKSLIALVGMPGAGKTEAALYLEKQHIPFVRFGEITDEGVQALGLPLTPENERTFRERIRQELGMAAYAIKAKPKIETLLKEHTLIVLDGLYSWEEYIFLKNKFPGLILVHIFAEPTVRYERLSKRPIRPVPIDICYKRDVAEIEELNKGGPIAIADYLLENNDQDIEHLHKQLEKLLGRIKAA